MSDLIERLAGYTEDDIIIVDYEALAETAREAIDTIKQQQAEIERLNKRHDDFLQEFWATNAENAKLQAVVDAAKKVETPPPVLRHALAALIEGPVELD